MRASSVDLAILDLLNQQDKHLNALEIYQHIHLRLPAVNPSTVYRSLERLAHSGKVSVSDLGTGAAVYEISGSEAHHHLICQCCGQVLPLDSIEVRQFFTRIEAASQFHIVTNHLILFGICASCQLRDTPSRSRSTS